MLTLLSAPIRLAYRYHVTAGLQLAVCHRQQGFAAVSQKALCEARSDSFSWGIAPDQQGKKLLLASDLTFLELPLYGFHGSLGLAIGLRVLAWITLQFHALSADNI